jgi:hypothetical protein
MNVFNLCTKADVDTLFEKHLPAYVDHRESVKLAIVYGSLDRPREVLTFAEDHYKCRPVVYEANEFGVLICVTKEPV